MKKIDACVRNRCESIERILKPSLLQHATTGIKEKKKVESRLMPMIVALSYHYSLYITFGGGAVDTKKNVFET